MSVELQALRWRCINLIATAPRSSSVNDNSPRPLSGCLDLEASMIFPEWRFVSWSFPAAKIRLLLGGTRESSHPPIAASPIQREVRVRIEAFKRSQPAG